MSLRRHPPSDSARVRLRSLPGREDGSVDSSVGGAGLALPTRPRGRSKQRPTILGLVLATLSCTQAHIGEYTPKRRDYKLPAETKGDQAAASPGSLWQEGRPASLLFTDARALRVNDLLVVKIDEQADAHRTTDTNTDRSSAAAAKIDAFMGLLKKLPSSIDPNLAIGGSSSNSFQSKGDTGRTEYLTATVPAVVTKVFNNGNLFVEGHRVILVNAEEQHFYISGVVRPIDIDQENTVKSSMVADAQIEFVGRGVLSDNQKPGWFSRMLGWIWPF
jgi:flagellar L-ring protein FlgH